MEIFGREINRHMRLWFSFLILIIIDIVLITIAMFNYLPSDISFFIYTFDFFVCIILLGDWIADFYKSNSKTQFLKKKESWINLIASIPFNVILPMVIPQVGLLRYLRLLNLLRVFVLFSSFFNSFESLIKKTNIHKVFIVILFIIFLFTFVLYSFGSSHSLFDYFYFVIVTITTVGYGDIVPQTFTEKVISLLLIFVGIFIFSTVTAVLSSFFTDRLLKKDDVVMDELNSIREENKELKQEIEELKTLIKNE